MALPQVFISYRQLDDAQRQRVRDFAERLRGRGIQVVLNQFFKDSHPGGPPEGWPKWSSEQAIHAEKVLIIGNEPWFRCFDGKKQPGTGLGAACEAGNLRQRIYDLGGEQDIIRVAYFDDNDVSALSFDLKRYHRFHIGRDFDDLVAWVKGTPFVPKASTETRPRALRFWSTRESIDKGEITVLAIIETALAVALLITLTVWFDTVKWIAGACAFAPLTLLRTKKSVERGLSVLDWAESGQKMLFTVINSISIGATVGLTLHLFRHGFFTWTWLVCPILLALGHWVYFFVIRALASLEMLFKNPLDALAAIPINWKRVTFTEDSHSQPVLMPGTINTAFDLVLANLPHIESVRISWQLLAKIIAQNLALFIAVPCLYAFTAAYRWSVKATCLIYLPLVWIANKAQYSPRTSVKAMLHDYLVDDIQRVRRWLAFLSVSALTMKVAVWWHLDDARAWAHEHLPLWALKVAHDWRHYLDPQHVPWWQITPAINGALAVGLFVYARRVLNLKDHVPADAVVLRNWRIVNVLSAALSIYTIVCVLLLTWKAGDLMGTVQKLWQMFDHRVLP